MQSSVFCVQVENHANVALCLQAVTPFGEISPVGKIIQSDDAQASKVLDRTWIFSATTTDNPKRREQQLWGCLKAPASTLDEAKK